MQHSASWDAGAGQIGSSDTAGGERISEVSSVSIRIVKCFPRSAAPEHLGTIWLRRVALAQLAMVCAAISFGQDNLNWTRDVKDGGTLKNYPKNSFLIFITSSIDNHLFALCAYQLVEGKAPTILHGSRNAEGDFLPFVSYEVATEDTVKWKQIASFSDAGNRVAVEIGPTNPRIGLHVDMDPFRPSIGKYRWGRLVLENGDAAPFAIDDLLPTGNAPDAAGNFKQFTNDVNPKRFGSSFSMTSLTSYSKHLTGSFIFIGGNEGSIADLEGSKTRDGDLWPDATLQAGNSNSDWQTIGKSTAKQTRTSLHLVNKSPWNEFRVPLDCYASVISKFKYGKIIFSNGSFAVFETVDLKPH